MRITSLWDILGIWKVVYRYYEVSLGKEEKFLCIISGEVGIKRR